MTERPIIFQSEMVKALLDGRKRMTRRTKGLEYINNNPERWKFIGMGGLDENPKYIFECETGRVSAYCHYGKIGDVIYVRETSRIVHINHNLKSGGFFTIQYKDFYVLSFDRVKEFQFDLQNTFYKNSYEISNGDAYGNWKSSIFMPKKAARIFLEITNVRIEQLNSITVLDCRSEGISIPNDNDTAFDALEIIDSFKTLWQSINGPESWDLNPWVFVIEFKQIKQ